MEEYFDFLNDLRESGLTNMFGATPYLQAAFPELKHDRKQARDILNAWMNSFQEEEREEAETPW